VMQTRFAAVMCTDEWIQMIRSNGVAERDGIYESNLRARNANIRKAA
jgi:hypothetical protein